MIAAIAVAALAVAWAMWRSGNDIADSIGPLDELMEADTSDGHYLTTLVLFVVGLAVLFFLGML